MEEKLRIAQSHLLPKQLSRHGLRSDAITVPPSVMELIVQQYTREAGVRGLEKELAQLCRYVAAQVRARSTCMLQSMLTVKSSNEHAIAIVALCVA